MRLTSLSYGVVRSLASPSTRQLSPVTGFTLEIAGLAMGTTNVRPASVRRLADEAAGCRLAEPRACGRYPQRKGIQPAGKMDSFGTIHPMSRWFDRAGNAASILPENATPKLTGRFLLKYC